MNCYDNPEPPSPSTKTDSRRRISKHEAAILQLLNKAISGNMPALRTYLGHYQIASEKVALREASQSRGPIKSEDIPTLSDEELYRLLYEEAQKTREQETKKGHISNVD